MRILMVVLALTAASACGGGERTLRMADADYTETEFRAKMRLGMADAGAANLCAVIHGLGDEDTADTVRDLNATAYPNDPTPTRTGVPGDRRRAAAILQEECARVF